jgi:hypothetical protein
LPSLYDNLGKRPLGNVILRNPMGDVDCVT